MADFFKNRKNTKYVGSRSNSGLGVCEKLATREKQQKKSRTNEWDFKCAKKKTNNVSDCAIEFRRLEFFSVYRVDIYLASMNQLSVSKLDEK